MIRKARLRDVISMARIINERASLGELLPRAQHQIYQTLRDFVVCEQEGQIVGTGAMHVFWRDLGEIRALAVAGPWQRKGIGTEIVRSLLTEAAALGITKVFAFTYKTRFFGRLGFDLVDRESLPRKVWGECVHCGKFPHCDETALLVQLDSLAVAASETAPEEKGRRDASK